MNRFYYAGSPRRRFRRRESKVGSNFALEPRQRADCDENKLRLVRAPGDRRTGHDDDAEATSFLAPQNHRSQASAFDALSDEEKAAALDVQKERPQRVRAKRAVSLSLATQIFKLYDAGHTVDEIATIVSRRPSRSFISPPSAAFSSGPLWPCGAPSSLSREREDALRRLAEDYGTQATEALADF